MERANTELRRGKGNTEETTLEKTVAENFLIFMNDFKPQI